MARNRKISRQRKKMRQQEERLEVRNAWGIYDPTPRDAVKEIIERGKIGMRTELRPKNHPYHVKRHRRPIAASCVLRECLYVKQI
jgi:ABC-type phosphonate transport system ATPase subunit